MKMICVCVCMCMQTKPEKKNLDLPENLDFSFLSKAFHFYQQDITVISNPIHAFQIVKKVIGSIEMVLHHLDYPYMSSVSLH